MEPQVQFSYLISGRSLDQTLTTAQAWDALQLQSGPWVGAKLPFTLTRGPAILRLRNQVCNTPKLLQLETQHADMWPVLKRQLQGARHRPWQKVKGKVYKLRERNKKIVTATITTLLLKMSQQIKMPNHMRKPPQMAAGLNNWDDLIQRNSKYKTITWMLFTKKSFQNIHILNKNNTYKSSTRDYK